ncbi:MAG: hormogonium polysaccharide biosynthesis glycosyltransferase HpsE [Cyanobacteriota bacterium]|nr:hormogonium polysaccharide biosynthesis glycosyltransferase HpsE [Cyanobacteriota bacterium]
MLVDFSVAIPTYNGAKRLPDVLDSLRSQTHLEQLSWEIIVVDNQSSDNTAAIVEAYQSGWPSESPLHYIFEGERGAAFARQRAIETAKGSYVGFLDDDNIPEPDWVRASYDFAQNHPQVGAFGSAISGEFLAPPPEELTSLHPYLGLINRGRKAHRYKPQNRVLPPTAGLVVRREAWLKAVPPRLFLNHTDKDAGLSCEDLEAVLYIQKAGWEIWYNPASKIRHKIAPNRWQKDYLLSVMRCNGLSRHHLRMLRLPAWQQPGATVAYWMKDFLQLGHHLYRYGRLPKTEIVEACNRQLLKSMLLSPFFLGKIRWENWKRSFTMNNE